LPSISWSISWSCSFQIHIQYCFGNYIFFLIFILENDQFPHEFISVKFTSACFEQIINHQEVTSLHAAYSIFSCWNYIKIMWIVYIYSVINSIIVFLYRNVGF
jgi:hypothetical protein